MNRKERSEAFVDEEFQVTVIGRHLLVTEAMKDYAFEKLSKIEAFLPRLVETTITMDVQKLSHIVDIVMRYNSIVIKSHGVSTDMYASIDIAVDKILHQVRRYKSRIQDHHAKSVHEVDLDVQVIHPSEENVALVNDEIEETNVQSLLEHYKPHQVVKTEKFSLKTLTLSEAIMKMDLSGQNFLMYRGEEDQKIRVIYRRKDDNYGVIQTEA